MIKKHKSFLLATGFILLVTSLLFAKIFLKGQYPIPGNLLVSFYFPWYSGGWEGYDPWTTHKKLLAADSIRQIYPWKEFATIQFKNGQVPLWNPYTFSGQPLLANFQSSVFYPTNILYFLTDPKNAWILLIVLQPFFAGIFMYMATRSFGISQIPSLFGSIVFTFSSYLVTWLENGNVIHTYLWLPLAIWSINLFFNKFQYRYLFFLTLALFLAVLGGHPQTAIYLYLATFLFFVFKIIENKISPKILTLYFSAVILSLALTSIQLIPTYNFYKDSPISLPFTQEVFDRSILPYKNLLTFFASDFFGHPATNNFWSESYGDFTPYIGVIPLIFALWAVVKLTKYFFVKFSLTISIFFILAAVKGPITYLISVFHLPFINASTPSRFMSISIFFLIILAALGFNDFINNLQNKKYLHNFLKFLIMIAFIYFILWLFAIFGSNFLTPKETWEINLAVTRRNLILPSAMFLSIVTLALGLQYINIIKKFGLTISVIGIFTATIIGGLYYSNKFLPFAPKKYIFPDHILLSWLSNNGGINRFYGGGTAHIDFNFPTHYKIFAAEGYDTLRFKRYAELMASSFAGKVPQTYLRSDAVFPNTENGYRRRLFEILGVKYLLDKDDNPKTGADWHFERFPMDELNPVLQYGKFQVYERKKVLPRVFQTTKYYVAKSDQEIIEKIYDANFDLKILILEKEPNLKIDDTTAIIIEPKIIKYEPNEVILETNLNYNSLLYLSDVYDKDWNVEVDSSQAELLRVHYALRAVGVPAGSHIITFKYQPQSFTLGLYVSASSIIVVFIAGLYFIRKKKF